MVNQRRVIHRHQSLPYPLLGAALAQVRDSDAWWGVKSCIAFLAFTCVRSEEARMATWDEINMDAATWSIPGNCSELRGSEQPAAFQEGIETSGPPGAKEGCQGHLAVGALP